jgi:tetratricopeptide (TPR) repeat protein
LFGANKNYYKESVKVLADEGYTDKYLSILKNELAAVKSPKPLAEGKSHLANAYLFRGELAKAYETFKETDLKKLNDIIAAILINNMIFCLFVQDKFKQADELFMEYNRIVLHEHTALMRRSLAIHEHINKRYENSVTILIKMNDVPDPRNNLYLDICLIKSMLRLDMYERAAEFSGNLDSYKDKGELWEEVLQLKKKIFSGISSEQKVKMIKKIR